MSPSTLVVSLTPPRHQVVNPTSTRTTVVRLTSPRVRRLWLRLSGSLLLRVIIKPMMVILAWCLTKLSGLLCCACGCILLIPWYNHLARILRIQTPPPGCWRGAERNVNNRRKKLWSLLILPRTCKFGCFPNSVKFPFDFQNGDSVQVQVVRL